MLWLNQAFTRCLTACFKSIFLSKLTALLRVRANSFTRKSISFSLYFLSLKIIYCLLILLGDCIELWSNIFGVELSLLLLFLKVHGLRTFQFWHFFLLLQLFVLHYIKIIKTSGEQKKKISKHLQFLYMIFLPIYLLFLLIWYWEFDLKIINITYSYVEGKKGLQSSQNVKHKGNQSAIVIKSK